MNQMKALSLVIFITLAAMACDKDKDPVSESLNWTYENAWGSGGTGNGQFDLITGLAIDAAGNQYVTDINQNRIQKLSNTGAFITKWGTLGVANGQFDWPRDVAIDSDGNNWVADQHNCRIQKFDPNGNFITSIGSCGSADGQFMDVFNIDIDKNDILYAVDPGNQRIQKFSLQGAHLLSWGYNQFMGFPGGITSDSKGDLYVSFNRLVDTVWTSTIVKYNGSGTVQDSWTINFQPTTYVASIDMDSQDNLHLGTNRGNIHIYKSDGTFIKSWGEQGAGPGQILALSELRFGPNDILYIAGCNANQNCRISKFNKQD